MKRLTCDISLFGEMLPGSSVVRAPELCKVLFLLYTVLSYFEAYLFTFIGASTKYLMLLIIAVLLLLYRGRIRINLYWISFVIWFIYWCITILWSSGANDTVSIHFLSEIGMVLFIVAIDGQVFDESFIRFFLQAHLWCSFALGILSIVFHEAHLGAQYEARQVLTLFGAQNDPNNEAAFLMTGIALAGYCALYEGRHVILHMLVVAVNTYATLLTGSRAGLVGVGLLGVIFVFLPSNNKKKYFVSTLKKLLFLGIAVAVLVFVVSRYLPVESLKRLLAFEEYEAGSGRAVKWQGALAYFYQRPVFGWGWGGMDFSDIGYADSAHNTYLTMLCEGGLFGLALFLVPVVTLAVRAVKKSILALILLICGLYPAFFVDAINKKFLWNAIILAILLTNYSRATKRGVTVWSPKKKDVR